MQSAGRGPEVKQVRAVAPPARLAVEGTERRRAAGSAN